MLGQMEAFFFLGQEWKRDCMKPWMINPMACDLLLRERWSHLFAIRGL